MANSNLHIPKKYLSKTQSLMLHGLGFVTGDETIKFSYPYAFHQGLRISVDEAGEAKWIYMMLPITKGSLITGINIAQQRTGTQTHVSIIRLTEQHTPPSSTVVHSEFLDKKTTSSYLISSCCHVLVRQSVVLKVCMDFHNTKDIIEIGSVEVSYIPNYSFITNFGKDNELFIKNNAHSIKHSFNSQRTSFFDILIQKKNKRL